MPDIDNRITFVASAFVDVDDMTEEQIARLEHHAEISRRVFAASIAGMVKGVKKYPPEPEIDGDPRRTYLPSTSRMMEYWFPHIFSEAVDCANQTGLFADALGVELCPTEPRE